MTDPSEEQQEQDKLDLDEETVQDLEVDEQSADALRGGRGGNSGQAACGNA